MNNKIKYQDLGLIDYNKAWKYQEQLFQEQINYKLSITKARLEDSDTPSGYLLFCEHPHVYTLGKSGTDHNLLINNQQLKEKGAVFIKTNRGGDITYHGPGQIVGYPIIDLENFNLSVKKYVFLLEESIIRMLDDISIKSERLEGATGVWIGTHLPLKARKICAIGVKISRYVTMHGFAFNVNTDLSYYNYINPCGFTDKGVTSIKKEMGEQQDFELVKHQLKNKIREVFGMTLWAG